MDNIAKHIKTAKIIKVNNWGKDIKESFPLLRKLVFATCLLYNLFKILFYVFIRQEKIIVCNNGIECLNGFILKKFKIIKKTISIIHDTSSLRFERNSFICKIQNQFWKESDMIITVSETSKEGIKHYYPNQKIEVVHSGI